MDQFVLVNFPLTALSNAKSVFVTAPIQFKTIHKYFFSLLLYKYSVGENEISLREPFHRLKIKGIQSNHPRINLGLQIH